MSIAEKLAAKEKERQKKLDELQAKAESKADLLRQKAEALRIQEEREAALRANAASDAEYQLELKREAEIKRKTKDYWQLDHNKQRVLLAPHFPSYFGDHISDRDAWIPHGRGEFRYNHQVVLEGTFIRGVIHGNGAVRSESGLTWEGEWSMGKMHGVGVLTSAEGVKREAIARNNMIICFKDELLDGKCVEVKDPTMGMVAQPMCDRVYLNIMYHVKDWKYRVRFHEEVVPRERDIIFCSLKWFKVLHHLPQVYHISRFGTEVDPAPRYDYWKDVYGPYMKGKQPKLGIAGGRRTAEMRAHNAEPLKPIQRTATKTDYKENVYESHMVGIGAAQEEEEIERKKEMKKKQFEALIEKRRADAEAERLKAVEEEQARITAEDLEKVKAKAREAAEEKQRHEEALQNALKEEANRYDAEAAQAAQESEERRIKDLELNNSNT